MDSRETISPAAGFEGFPRYNERSVSVPDVFFTRLAPQMRSLLELKITLHLMWALSQRSGLPRCIEYQELAADMQLAESLKLEDGPRPAEDFLREGLELAVTRGTVLQVRLKRQHGQERWYFLNTVASREAIEQLRTGDFSKTASVLGTESIHEVNVYRPNIYALYEQNIGTLTPIIADRLRAAETQYPSGWIEDAIEMAVSYNKRNWRYMEAILKRWEAQGKDDGLRSIAEEEDSDPYGYFRSKYQSIYR